MDCNKLCEKIISDESLKDIPLIYIVRVAYALVEIINSGECFFDRKEVDACT